MYLGIYKSMGKTLKIDRWHGRLGNNIIQVRNCIQQALQKECDIIFPEHDFFNDTSITISNNNQLSDEITEEGDFFRMPLDMSNKKIVIKTLSILREKFKYNYTHTDTSNELLIHIRGGDLFYKSKEQLLSLPNYTPPPLCYYTKIIEGAKTPNIVLLTEDDRNPCVQKLLELYPAIVSEPAPLEVDVQRIINTQNVAFGIGTFVSSLLMLNKNIKTVYRPSYNPRELFHDAEINYVDIDLGDYKERMGTWTNSPEQKKLLLDFEL